MLPSLYQQFIHVSRYARFDDDKKRRENFQETVDRYIDFMCEDQCKGRIDATTKSELRSAILNLDVMPSMRCLMTAGEALRRDEIAGYNCSALYVDSIQAFDETMYLLMSGVGVGFSVEPQFISKLPTIPSVLRKSKTVIHVEDSRIGWANAFREFISMLYQGRVPNWDVSEVRPQGARIKTFGGIAPGPGPLVDLFLFCIDIFQRAAGRKLSSLECHDIMCKIGDIVVSGGKRRSALISLSSPYDDNMKYAKSGNWYETAPWRAQANNSAVYDCRPSMDVFFREWLALYESKSGERGIINRNSIKEHMKKFGRRNPDFDFIVNPCGEINLRSMQTCNLSEVVIRPDDTVNDIKEKIRLATIAGTMQASLTNFRYLRPDWKLNAEEEALLGVSLTGIMDHELFSSKSKELCRILNELREYAVTVNREWAPKIGVNPSAAVTTLKPSGTVSQLVDCSSGIHPRYSRYYIRTVRSDNKDPITRLLKESGIPNEPDVIKPQHVTVFSFPIKAPDHSVLASNLTAVDMLELWKLYKENWSEHSVSCTVYVRENEWLEVGSWVYKNFDTINGVSFLPYVDHIYRQAPYQPISEKEYLSIVEKFPKSVNWEKLAEYDSGFFINNINTEYACTGNSCEFVDITN